MKHTMIFLLAVLLAGLQAPAWAANLEDSGIRDAFIAGQLTAILERELGWQSENYSMKVTDGVARITSYDTEAPPLPSADEMGIKDLAGIELVSGEELLVQSGDETVMRKAFSFLGLTEHTEAFPIGELFQPLIAYEHEPRFFASVRPYKFTDPDGSTFRTTLGATGFGTSFGLWRRDAETPGNGLQLSISAAVFSQFDLEADSFDLINADYIVGFPLTYRRNSHSLRLRLYHQSSHLGDEYLINDNPERINFSYEALEFLYSWDKNNWRIYDGGEYAINVNPSDLDKMVLRGGMEYRLGAWQAGLDVSSVEQHDWETSWGLKAGYEFPSATHGQRLKIYAEAFDGFTPHGQFYDIEATYYGIGAYFGY